MSSEDEEELVVHHLIFIKNSPPSELSMSALLLACVPGLQHLPFLLPTTAAAPYSCKLHSFGPSQQLYLAFPPRLQKQPAQ